MIISVSPFFTFSGQERKLDILVLATVEKEEVLMYNNSCVVLVSKEVEELEKEEETYNFEVEDNHNYFVGESLILVHNACSSPDESEFYKMANKGHSKGRSQPNSTSEGIAFYDAMTYPSTGTKLNIELKDPRWKSNKGLVKMQKVYYGNFNGVEGNITIHYVMNCKLRLIDDFKIPLR